MGAMMRSGFKRSLAVMASAMAGQMMDWSKAFTAETPPEIANLKPHSFARKARIPSASDEGKRSRANAALAARYASNPMHYLPGRDTARLMRIKGYGQMMMAANAALDEYRAHGQCLDKVQPRRAT